MINKIINKTFTTLKTIWTHPLNKNEKFKQIIKFFFWQINCLVFKKTVKYNVTKNFSINVIPRQASSTANYYLKLHEYVEMLLLVQFLNKDDLFIDIGSNIGEYALLASAETGCNSIAIEPIDSSFKFLTENIKLNKLEKKVKALRVGVSNKTNFEYFSNNLDSENYVLPENDLHKDSFEKVQTTTLDAICRNTSPSCLKIDVEGYEPLIFENANETLKKKELKVIIIELRGHSKKYQRNDDFCRKILIRNGFEKIFYDPFNKRFLDKELYQQANEIYVKNKNEVLKKINSNNSSVFLDGLVI